MIVITGTPGTGKSVISKLVGKRLNLPVIDLNQYIKENRLYDSYDRKRKTYVFDIKNLEKTVNKFEKNSIIESHMAHFIPRKYVDIVFVFRTNPAILEKRLKKRNWSSTKISENVEAELIGLISYEANKRHKNVAEINTTKSSKSKIVNEIVKHLKDDKLLK